jgi:hypothetical protein
MGLREMGIAAAAVLLASTAARAQAADRGGVTPQLGLHAALGGGPSFGSLGLRMDVPLRAFRVTGEAAVWQNTQATFCAPDQPQPELAGCGAHQRAAAVEAGIDWFFARQRGLDVYGGVMGGFFSRQGGAALVSSHVGLDQRISGSAAVRLEIGAHTSSSPSAVRTVDVAAGLRIALR